MLCFLVTGGTSYSNLSFILERMFGVFQTVDPWKLRWLSRSPNLCYSSPLLGMNAYFQDIQSACHFLVSVSNQCDVIDIMDQSWSRSRSCPIGGRKTSLLPSNKCSQWKTLQLSQWKAVFTWTFTFLQWTFFLSFLFFFFYWWLPCSKSLLYVSPWSTNLFARWDIAWFMSHLVNPIRSSNLLS